MKLLNYSILLVGMLFVSCAGVKFANAPVNKQIPEAFTQRSIYPGGVAGYDFQDLVGNILFIETNKNPIRIGVIRPLGYVNTVIPITDSNNFYRSRIQAGAEAQGSYLAFAAKFSADEMAELTLDDIARAGIEIKDEATWTNIKNKITKWVAQHQKFDPNSSRLWIKSVVLSRRVYNSQTKINANASGQVGDVVGVKSGIYRKDDDGIRSVMLGFEAFDIDKLASASVGKKATISSEELFEKAKFKGIIDGTIEKP